MNNISDLENKDLCVRALSCLSHFMVSLEVLAYYKDNAEAKVLCGKVKAMIRSCPEMKNLKEAETIAELSGVARDILNRVFKDQTEESVGTGTNETESQGVQHQMEEVSQTRQTSNSSSGGGSGL